MIERHESGALLSKAARGGGLVATSGLVAPDALDAATQMSDVLALVDQHLLSYGVDRSAILHALIHLKDMKDFSSINAVWQYWLAGAEAPCRTCVTATLPNPRALVEVTVLAIENHEH